MKKEKQNSSEGITFSGIYLAPDFKVSKIGIEQNILASGSSEALPGFSPEIW